LSTVLGLGKKCMQALVRIGIVDEEEWDPSDKVPLIGDCMDAAQQDWIDLVVLTDP